MNKKKLNKRLIIIFLILFPTAMFFVFLTANAQAETYVPEEDGNNNWHWHDDITEGTKLYYEYEIIMRDNETDEITMALKLIEIMEIDSIGNITSDLMGPQEVSQINATNYYYDCETKSLVQYGDPYQIAEFGYNSTQTPYERYFTGEFMIFPIILPFNKTGDFEGDILSDILNETLYYNMYNFGYMNYFDDYGNNEIDSEKEEIWFSNSSSQNYFINMTYFQDNGTLYEGEAEFLMYIDDDDGNGNGNGDNGGPHGWTFVEYEVKRVFDYNITDDIEWSVKEGETYYYGNGEMEAKIDIIGFNCSNYPMFSFGDEIPMPFQNVLADISIWNYTDEVYEIEMSNIPVAYANELYPFHPMIIDQGEEGGGGILAIPNSTERDDMEFIADMYKMFGVDSDLNDDYILEVESKEEDFKFMMNFDNKTGLLKISTLEGEGQLRSVMFRKNSTKVENDIINMELNTELVDPFDVYINMSVTEAIDAYWAILPVNPLEAPIESNPLPFIYEIPDFSIYLDMYVNKSLAVSEFNFSIYYDQTPLDILGIVEDKLKVYSYSPEDQSMVNWEELDPSNYSIDEVNNRIDVWPEHSSYFTVGIEESWNWSDDIFDAKGDLLIYESLGGLQGNITELGGVVNIPYINFAILNITDVGLGTRDYMGDPQEFNQVNASLMYYNPLIKDLETWDDAGKFTLSEYYYNESRSPDFYLNLTENMLGFPMIVPLRWGELALPKIGRVLNNTFYSSQLARDIGFPIWNDIRVNTLTNTLIFNDTTTDYFMEITYYDNGTLKDAEVSTQFTIDNEDIEFNLTSTRLFDINTTDEIEWGLEVGESYYFGSNYPEGGATIEANITIVKINQSAVMLADLFGFGSDAFMFQTWLTFENVWGKMEYWNITDLGSGTFSGEWVPMDDDIFIIAAANNYFPFAPGDYLSYHGFDDMELVPILTPKGTTGFNITEDFLFYLVMHIKDKWDESISPTVAAVSDNYLRIDLVAPGYPEFSGYLEWYLDVDTGITRLYYEYLEEGDEFLLTSIFLKNHTSGSGPSIDTYEFNNYLVPDITIDIDIESVGGYDFFEAMLNKNPVNSSMLSGYGTPMFFTDIFYINKTPHMYNLTFTMQLPAHYNVQYVKYAALYMVDYDTGEGHWSYELLTDIPFGDFSKDTDNNILTLRVENMNGSISSILAWMYSPPAAAAGGGGGGGGGDKDETPEVPGYDVHLLIMVISLISIIIVINRRKIIRIKNI